MSPGRFPDKQGEKAGNRDPQHAQELRLPWKASPHPPGGPSSAESRHEDGEVHVEERGGVTVDVPGQEGVDVELLQDLSETREEIQHPETGLVGIAVPLEAEHLRKDAFTHSVQNEPTQKSPQRHDQREWYQLPSILRLEEK